MQQTYQTDNKYYKASSKDKSNMYIQDGKIKPS